MQKHFSDYHISKNHNVSNSENIFIQEIECHRCKPRLPVMQYRYSETLSGQFLIVPNCSLGLLKCVVSMATVIDFSNGGRPTKSIVSRVLLILEH